MPPSRVTRWPAYCQLAERWLWGMTPMADFGGRYRQVKRLGAGGMGEVWLALDMELDERPVAVKRMYPQMLADAEDAARFQREMRLAARMQHPNIMTVFTTGTDNGVPFMQARRTGSPTRSWPCSSPTPAAARTLPSASGCCPARQRSSSRLRAFGGRSPWRHIFRPNRPGLRGVRARQLRGAGPAGSR